jgi:hypothetical protein
MKKYFALLLALCSLTACRDYPEGKVFDPPKKITVGPGPEDIAIDERHIYPRIILSCASRREEYGDINRFEELNLLTDEVRTLPIIGLPPGLVLGPHGIDIAYRDGKTWLYAVNHESETIGSVLVFELQADQLVFSERLHSPLIVSPNDLCVDAEGRLFVSNDRGGPDFITENLFRPNGSSVLMFDGSNWYKVASGLSYANGLLSLDGQLYVAGTRENYMYRYDIESDTVVNQFNFANALLGQDNISLHEGKIYIAVHTSIMQFVEHSFSTAAISPFAVFSIDIATGEKKMMYSNDGTLISGVSTAIRYGDYLYLSQIFEPFLMKVQVN